jgi:chromosome segregation ATPase
MYSQRDIPKMKISRREVEYEASKSEGITEVSSSSRRSRSKDRGGKELTYDFKVEPVTTQVHHEVHQVHHNVVPDNNTVHLQHELGEARSTIVRLEREISEMRGKYTTQISNVEIYDNKYKKDLEDSHKKIFEMGKTNELQQRTIEDLRRDYDTKIRHFEEQLTTSERMISELKMQCNDGRQRHIQGEDDYNERQRRFSELREKCERADVEEARKDRLIHQLQRELSKYSESSEVELTSLKTSVKRVTEEKELLLIEITESNSSTRPRTIPSISIIPVEVGE